MFYNILLQFLAFQVTDEMREEALEKRNQAMMAMGEGQLKHHPYRTKQEAKQWQKQQLHLQYNYFIYCTLYLPS